MSVIVYLDHSAGKVSKLSLDAVFFGSKVAEQLKTQVIAVAIGNAADAILAKAGNFGASKVIRAKHDLLKNFDPKTCSKVLAQVVEKTGAKTIIFSHGFTSKSLATYVSASLKAGIATNATEVPKIENGQINIKSAVYAGKAFLNVTLKSTVNIITVQPNILSPVLTDATAPVEDFTPFLDASDPGYEVVAVNKAGGKVLLTEASVIVSGGRGMKGPENWHLLESLADLLNAGIACSKPVSDMHWRPHSEHVGQTGLTVRPNLYIAVGISGAIQHLAGVNGSKYLVAINTDPEAPVFKAADYGIVGDAFKVLPKINEAVAKLKQ